MTNLVERPVLDERVGNDGRHHRPYKAQAHHDDYFFAALSCDARKFLQASVFDCVIFLGWQRKLFAGWTNGEYSGILTLA